MNKPIERPVIFSAQEVNAVLAGDKTQHRVPVDIDHSISLTYHSLEAGGASPERIDALPFECPLGNVGDRLWVQELHARTESEDLLTRTHYYADGTLRPDLRHDAGLLIKHSAEDMPRWASRILLEITNIRIERVQDISEGDAISEGVKAISKCPDMNGPNNFTIAIKNYHFSQPTAKACYAYLHYLRHGDESWDRNDWVWVVEFKVIKENEFGTN